MDLENTTGPLLFGGEGKSKINMMQYHLYVESKKYTNEFDDKTGSSCHGTAETNLTRNHEGAGLIPGLAQWRCHELWHRLQMELRSCVAVAVV